MEIFVTIFFIITIIVIGVFFKFFFKALLFIMDKLIDFVLRLFFREELDMYPAECALQKGRICIFHPSIKGYLRSYLFWIGLFFVLIVFPFGFCSLVDRLLTGEFDHYTTRHGGEYNGPFGVVMNTIAMIMFPFGLCFAYHYLKYVLLGLIEYDRVETVIPFERIKSITETCTNNLLQRCNGVLEIENVQVKSDTYQELNIDIRFIGFPKYGFMVHIVNEGGYIHFNVIGKKQNFLRRMANGIGRKFKLGNSDSVKPKSRFCYYVRNNLMYNMKLSFEQDLPVDEFDGIQKEFIESKLKESTTRAKDIFRKFF